MNYSTFKLPQGHYSLTDNHEVIPCDDFFEWSNHFANPHVAVTILHPDVKVSTIFLGLDYELRRQPPLVFETMIFGGVHGNYQRRCATWDQALELHDAAVQLAKSSLPTIPDETPNK